MRTEALRPRHHLLVSAGACAALLLGAAACGESTTGANEPAPEFTVPGKPTTTPTTMASAAGKPCVAPVDVPAADGKPTVEMPIGPPPTELVKVDLVEGTGAEVPEGATVKAHYVGIACSTGKQFDSSWDRGEPTEFPLTGVIPGWGQGIPGMKVGGRRQLNIPSNLAYGPEGRAPEIAPDEALVFVVEIVEVVTGDSSSSTTPGSTAAGDAGTTTTGAPSGTTAP